VVCALAATSAHAHVLGVPIGDAPPQLVVPDAAQGCPATTTLESTDRLLADNRVMASFGRRPTGSPGQAHFVDWLERQLRAIGGLQVGSVPYTIDRWVERGATLSVGGARVPLSGAVPYARPGTVTAPLAYVPPGTALTPDNAKGRIVVRDAVPGTVPYAAFRAVEWFEWDPDGTLASDAPATYERDFAGYNQRITDLEDAAKAGAAGLVFVHGFPRGQVRGQYAPYEGTHWKVPA